MMATLLSLVAYLLYILCMMALSFLVFIAMSEGFSPSFTELPDFIKAWIVFIIPMALKHFQWVSLISESHYTFPPSVSQVIVILLWLACYLISVMILPVLLNACALIWSEALGQHRDKDQLPDWVTVTMLGVTFLLTDRVTNSYVDPAFVSEFLSGSLRLLTYILAALFSLAGYFVYIACMMALSFLVGEAMSKASLDQELPDYMFFWIVLILPFALKNFLWLVIISESHYTLPSSVAQVIAIFVCLACYLISMMIVTVVVNTWPMFHSALEQQLDHELTKLIIMIMIGVSFVAMDMFMSYSNMAMNPGFISELLVHIMGPVSFLMYLIYIMCIMAASCLVLAIAHVAILNTTDWWPELIHTSIVALTLLLLNMIWGSPFEKPSTASDFKSALVGIAGYLIYIVSSMALTYNLFGLLLLLKTLVISLTFVLLDMFVKPSSVSETLNTLVGLTGMIGTALMALFFLVALSFMVFMFLHTWADILLPSTRRDYPAGAFVGIVGLTFVAMKTILGAIPVEDPSIFSDMKVGLLGIAHMIDDYRGVYMVIRYFTVIAVPLLSMESRRIVSMYNLYTMAALMVALGLVLTMPITENSASTLVTDDFVQQTITSLVNTQIKRMDGGIELLTDS